MRYFNGLNSLRFFASILVAISHTAISLYTHGITHVFDFSAYSFFQNGGISVEFFFVLSGFLITGLLLDEFRLNSTINIRHFYFRRILRIWPLYYLILMLYFLIVPLIIQLFDLKMDTKLTTSQFVLYLFFMPNVVRVLCPITALSPLWSIGVEEQFYLVWAPILKFFKQRLVAIFLIIIILKLILNLLYVFEFKNSSSLHNMLLFMSHLKIESMAIGGIGAYYLEKNKLSEFQFIFKPIPRVVIFSILFLVLFAKPILLSNSNTAIVLNEPLGLIIRSTIFLYVILLISLHEEGVYKLNNPILNQLGSLSYGIYMYHIMVELCLINFLKPLFAFDSKILSTFSYYILFIGISILISYLSFILIEKRFLKYKDRFAISSKASD